MKAKIVKGMRDIGPPEIKIWKKVEKVASKILESAGFNELRTPILEELALFQHSLGDTTEIIEKEMYAFADRKGRMLAMRPEGTAPIVRAFIESYRLTPYHKIYYSGPMFRYERPQKGRYRQFHQIGAEVFGPVSPLADAELIQICHSIFEELSIKNISLHLNSLGCSSCRPKFKTELLQFFSPVSSNLCEDCQKRLEKNPLRILDCKNENCKKETENAPTSLSVLCDPCRDHFSGVQKWLQLFKVPYTIENRLVRGLDYYQRTTFEFITNDLGAQNAVAGGGRYDGLVQQLGGPSLPAVGFGIGMDRLVHLLEKEELKIDENKIYFVCLGEEAQSVAVPFIKSLRKEWIVEIEPDSKSLKSQFRTANQLETDYAVIIGEEEIKSQKVKIKKMKEDFPQEEIPFISLVDYFEKKSGKTVNEK